MDYPYSTTLQVAPIPRLPLPPLRPGPVLFLDFDGVLHRPPLRVKEGLPALDPEYPEHQLFERLHLLEQVVVTCRVSSDQSILENGPGLVE